MGSKRAMIGPIDLVVFDMAGTTIQDSGGIVLGSLVEAARIHDLPSTPEELNAMMGMDKREVFTILAERCHSSGSDGARDLSRAALASFIESMRNAYDRDLAPIPGAEETLAFLRARGIKVATDTGFDAVIGGLILQRLDWPGRLVDTSVFSTDVPRGRPAPYMIFEAMQRLGVLDVRRVIKIGDSPADLEEGANAGCGEVIGVLSGAHTAATLGPVPHTRLLASVADLPSLFA